ncbi:hypothetical protein M885DRAFT_618544 [Pelagophyceae sp. CCMP2097]|nr:hypothetical protein M885DRAFT_618544 [Pelagophyceae sp. CCMP2097]
MRRALLCLAAARARIEFRVPTRGGPSAESGGDYALELEGEQWFDGGAAAIVLDGALYASDAQGAAKRLVAVPQGWAPSRGFDARLGDYDEVSRSEWAAPSAPARVVLTTWIRLFQDEDNFAIFGHAVAAGVSSGLNVTEEKGSAMTAFPAWRANLKDLNVLSFAGCQLQDSQRLHFGPCFDTNAPIANESKAEDAVPANMPMVAFDAELRTVVISPLSNFFVSTQRGVIAGTNGKRTFAVSAGILDTVDQEFTRAFSHETLIVAGVGVGETMRAWGALLRRGSAAPPKMQARALTNTHLGYYTDNGAYYYYNTEPGKTYEETMCDIRVQLVDVDKLPVKYFQHDSWWYYKSDDGGAEFWEPTPETFPHGFDPNYGSQLPLVLHNRWFSPTTRYLDNYTFLPALPGDAVVVPIDPHFFEDVFRKALKWGMAVYEQDFLTHTYSNSRALRSNPGLAERWLSAMNAGAQRNNITIQYCMALPRHILASVAYDRVTHARASKDYGPGRDQWSYLGVTSLLYDSLNLIPFKDSFWSSSDQPRAAGKRNYTFEANPELQTLVALLTKGPVAPSDGIGFANATRLMQTCRNDGLLLQADGPATICEEAFRSGFLFGDEPPPPLPVVWEASAAVGGLVYNYVFAADLSESFGLPLDDGAFAVARDFYSKNVTSLTGALLLETPSAHGAAPSPSGDGVRRFGLWMLAPEISGWVLLGDADKYVSVSSTRFPAVRANETHLEVDVVGVQGEAVNVDVLHAAGMLSARCTFDAQTRLVVRCTAGRCACGPEASEAVPRANDAPGLPES